MKFYESIILIKKNKTRAIGTGFKTNPSNKFLCAFAFANDIRRLPSNFATRLTSVDHEVFSQRLLPCVVHVLFSVVKLSHSLWLTNRLLQRQVQRIKVSGILRHGEVKFQRRKDRFQHLYVYYKLSTLLAEWYKLPKLWFLSLLRQSDYARTHWVSNRRLRFTIFTNKLLPWPGIPLISKVNRRRKFAVLKNGATNFQHGRSRPCQGLLW